MGETAISRFDWFHWFDWFNWLPQGRVDLELNRRGGETAQSPGLIGLIGYIGYSGCGLRVAVRALVIHVFYNGQRTTDKVSEF
jgi:hypothetical protein